MKKPLIISAVIIFGFILTSVFVNGSSQAQSEVDLPIPQIPQNMIDLKHPDPSPDFEPLGEPIISIGRLIEVVAPHDQVIATWADPWSPASIANEFDYHFDQPLQVNTVLESGRFTIAYLSSYTEIYKQLFNEQVWLAPEVEAQDGTVWALRVDGDVQTRFIGNINDNTTYDSVTYMISSRTGLLLGVKTGLPIVVK